MKKLFLIATLFITACYPSTQNNMQTYQAPSFDNQQTIKLDANKVVVISEFSPSFQRPNVEHLFPVSIEKATKAWANDRLEAGNLRSSKEVVVTIVDASVTEELIKSEKFLYKDQLKYKANLHATVKLKDQNSFSTTQTEIIAWRELTIPYDTPIQQKEKYWNAMVEKLLNDFDKQMSANIYQYLKNHIMDN